MRKIRLEWPLKCWVYPLVPALHTRNKLCRAIRQVHCSSSSILQEISTVTLLTANMSKRTMTLCSTVHKSVVKSRPSRSHRWRAIIKGRSRLCPTSAPSRIHQRHWQRMHGRPGSGHPIKER